MIINQIKEDYLTRVTLLKKEISSPYKRQRAIESLRSQTVTRIRAVEEAQLEVRLSKVQIKVESLKKDPAMIRTVKRFYGSTPIAWRGACRNDGRLRKLPDTLGWALLWSLISEMRRSI